MLTRSARRCSSRPRESPGEPAHGALQCSRHDAHLTAAARCSHVSYMAPEQSRKRRRRAYRYFALGACSRDGLGRRASKGRARPASSRRHAATPAPLSGQKPLTPPGADRWSEMPSQRYRRALAERERSRRRVEGLPRLAQRALPAPTRCEEEQRRVAWPYRRCSATLGGGGLMGHASMAAGR